MFMIITSDVALDHNKQTLGSLVCIRIHVAPRMYVMPQKEHLKLRSKGIFFIRV